MVVAEAAKVKAQAKEAVAAVSVAELAAVRLNASKVTGSGNGTMGRLQQAAAALNALANASHAHDQRHESGWHSWGIDALIGKVGARDVMLRCT